MQTAVQDALRSLSVESLKGVGPKTAERLARLHIYTVQDLLFLLPLRYQDRTQLAPIGGLRPGDEAMVEGEVQLTEVKFAKRRMLLSRISDGTGSLTLRFFHFNAAQQQNLARGTRLRCYGEVRKGAATLEMVHPEYQLLQDKQEAVVAEGMTPIYPTTEGMHQLTLRELTGRALELLKRDGLVEWLPEAVREAQQMMSLGEAVALLHRPSAEESLALLEEGEHPAQQRLIFEELLAQHLSLRRLRDKLTHYSAPALNSEGRLQQQLLHRLPFSPTAAQSRVVAEISHDLQQPHPMQRLVQGDVGSGKTLVALLAALQVVEAGYQVALMAPTEILAEQHFQNFHHSLSALGIEVAWLSGKLTAAKRREMMALISSGQARIAVGTHALFQDEVVFDHLGLVIIDEQHRFGVHQRMALREKGRKGEIYPHQLIMTATPIPRTLAMTAYADLDVSIIDELPPGRTPVETIVIPDNRRDEVVMRVGHACAEGRQAYWVCTLIEESESLQCQAAEESALLLQEALPSLRVGLVHGRMKPLEKEQAMAAFKSGAIDLLVATTVIEVGVDVPNASLMVIENAERLGLSQLHQLRGRVGRGSAKSSCVLMYHGNLGEVARERLGVMRETNDGFEIAKKDLQLRGPGEVLGTRQTGVMQMRIADLQRDQHLLPQVAAMAEVLLRDHPQSVEPLIQRWVGERETFADV